MAEKAIDPYQINDEQSGSPARLPARRAIDLPSPAITEASASSRNRRQKTALNRACARSAKQPGASSERSVGRPSRAQERYFAFDL